MDFTNFDKYLGEQLVEARLSQNITQEKVTKAISEKMVSSGAYKKGLSRQAYSNYELGIRSMPDKIFRFACEVLSLDYCEVFDKANTKFSSNYKKS